MPVGRSYPDKYVLGFAFTPGNEQVALIQKDHPSWQAGKWNGVGGRREDKEPVAKAMSREFYEETDVHIPSTVWRRVGYLQAERKWHVTVFTVTSASIKNVRTTTSEIVRLWEVSRASNMHLAANALIPNVPALIELCLMRANHNGYFPLHFTLKYQC